MREEMGTYKGIFKIHSDRILKKTISLVNIKEKEIVLDFGCENQNLKEVLLKCKYVGYDINSKYSDINNLDEVNPDIIFFLNVIEHIPKDSLREILKRYKGKKMIFAFPSENIVSKIGNFILNRKKKFRIWFLHINRPRELANILMEELGEPDILKKINLGTQIICVYN